LHDAFQRFRISISIKQNINTDFTLPNLTAKQLKGKIVPVPGVEVVSLTCWPAAPLPRGRYLVPIIFRERVEPRAIVRLEELGKLKNPPHRDSIPRPSGL
jgi:hypothetical protein